MHPTISPATRTWLYGVVLAALPIAVAYGLIADGDAALWVALAGAALGILPAGLATAYRPTRPDLDAAVAPEPHVE